MSLPFTPHVFTRIPRVESGATVDGPPAYGSTGVEYRGLIQPASSAQQASETALAGIDRTYTLLCNTTVPLADDDLIVWDGKRYTVVAVEKFSALCPHLRATIQERQ